PRADPPTARAPRDIPAGPPGQRTLPHRPSPTSTRPGPGRTRSWLDLWGGRRAGADLHEPDGRHPGRRAGAEEPGGLAVEQRIVRDQGDRHRPPPAREDLVVQESREILGAAEP